MSQYKSICNSIYDHPEDWEATEYYFIHFPTKLALWIANGFLSIGSKDSPVKVELSFYGRWKVWRAYKCWLNWNVDHRLNQKRLPEGRD